MESFRPLVDRAAVHITVSRGKDAPMDRETKGALIFRTLHPLIICVHLWILIFSSPRPCVFATLR